MIQTTLFPDTFKRHSSSHKSSSHPVDSSHKNSHATNEEALFSSDIFSNDDVANMFEKIADLLTAKGGDYYRIRAYRKGARSVRLCETSVIELYKREGIERLQALPYIGDRLSGLIQELATTGKIALLEKLLAEVSPEDLFIAVPGIGKVLAGRIYHELGIVTLEDLEQAAYDGTLERIEGFGAGRVQIVAAVLETMLARVPRPRLRRWNKADEHTVVA